jgi:magnesium transporter
VFYRDLDPDGREAAIRFVLTPQHITILEFDHFDLQRVTDWAVSGLLKTAPDLAQLLGMDMLEHHQKRLEQFEDKMDHIEDGIMDGPQKWQLVAINALQKQIIRLKKSLNAHETIFAKLERMDKLDNGQLSWRELVAQTQRELENARQTHELVVSLRESYQMAIDNWSNDIMKVLTLLATILLPITLVTGFFGMNFEILPLIHSPYGMTSFYLFSILIIAAVLVLFWRKHWLK